MSSAIESDDADLKSALRSYVLAGALKLFRQSKDPTRYRAEHLRHHTMLIHTSPSRGAHDSLGDRLKTLWDECVLNAPQGLKDLDALWISDFRAVSSSGAELVPATFTDLIPHLAESIKRIEKGPRVFLVVNSDTKEAPDFSAAPVWKIIVGGNKLSRGYTIEGLTTSYYRRVAGAADTLMQMGRWFGFRPGYQDLVRVYLGVREGKPESKKKSDLVSLFKEACRMEEQFRNEVERYVRKAGGPKITPKQIPPLIALSGSLPPTARNKMFHAVLKNKNFGGQHSMLTLAPTKRPAMTKNVETLAELLKSSQAIGNKVLGGKASTGKAVQARTLLLRAKTEVIVQFLKSYRWIETDYKEGERPVETNLQIEFLEQQEHKIESWCVLAPQRSESFGSVVTVEGLGSLAVKERKRNEDRGFQVFGEPIHRQIAKYLCGLDAKDKELREPNEVTEELRNIHQGVILLYPVRETPTDGVSVGYELLFPNNDLPFELNITVKKKAD